MDLDKEGLFSNVLLEGGASQSRSIYSLLQLFLLVNKLYVMREYNMYSDLIYVLN